MRTTRMLERRACPFLRPEAAEHLEAFPVGVYCRLPGGHVRIPSRDELMRFCTTGRFYDCLAYRRARVPGDLDCGLRSLQAG